MCIRDSLNDEIMEFANKEMDNVVLSIDGRKEVHDRMRPVSYTHLDVYKRQAICSSCSSFLFCAFLPRIVNTINATTSTTAITISTINRCV